MRVILDRATRWGEEQIKLLGAVFIEDFDSDSEDEDSVQGLEKAPIWMPSTTSMSKDTEKAPIWMLRR